MCHQRYLIVKGAAGLGNRLCSLANAIEYAKRTDRAIVVDWSDGLLGPRGTNAFPLYFELSGVDSASLEILSGSARSSSYPARWGDHIEMSIWDLYRRRDVWLGNQTPVRQLFRRYFPRGRLRKLQRHWCPREWCDGQAGRFEQFPPVAMISKECFNVGGDLSFRLSEELVFHCDYCPSFNADLLRQCIRPSASVREWVDRFCHVHKLTIGAVGVHIRMTDLSPTGPLTHAMELVRGISLPQPRVFLSTDSSLAEGWMRERIPDIVMIPKVPLRSPPGIGRHYYARDHGNSILYQTVARESVLDMILLSRCEYLICQANSSFSKVAAIFRNVPDKTFEW